MPEIHLVFSSQFSSGQHIRSGTTHKLHTHTHTLEHSSGPKLTQLAGLQGCVACHSTARLLLHSTPHSTLLSSFILSPLLQSFHLASVRILRVLAQRVKCFRYMLLLLLLGVKIALKIFYLILMFRPRPLKLLLLLLMLHF